MRREKRGTGSKLVETITGMTKTEIAVNSPKQMISRTEISNAVAWLGYSGIIGECGLYNNGDVNDYIPARRLYYMDCGSSTTPGAPSFTAVIGALFILCEICRTN